MGPNCSRRIVTAAMERVATQNTSYTLPNAAKNTIFFYGFDHVLGAGRRESALAPQKRANSPLIEANELDNDPSHRMPQLGDQSLGHHHEDVFECRVFIAE